MAKEKQTCETCLYFSAPKVCRRFPPNERRQTTVVPTDWCGEYKKK